MNFADFNCGLALAVASTRKFLPSTVTWLAKEEKLRKLGWQIELDQAERKSSQTTIIARKKWLWHLSELFITSKRHELGKIVNLKLCTADVE